MSDPRPTSTPRFVRCGRIYVNREQLAGHWGACPGRGCLGFVSHRNREIHHLHELGAYAISVNVLAKIVHIGVERVFIAETNTRNILEYRIEQFLEEGEPLPDKYLHDLLDPQRFAGTEVAHGRWEDELDDFYLDRPVDEWDALQAAGPFG